MKSDLEAIDAIIAGAPAVVVDVGAHQGDFATHFAARGYRVIAVEPFAYNVRYLRNALAPYSNTQIVEAAISEETGEAELYIDGPSSMATLSKGWINGVFPEYFRSFKSVTVRALSWTDFVREAGLSAIELLKTDCEGLDESILKSMLKSDGPLPRILLYEGRGSGTPEGRRMRISLEAAGYAWLQHFYLDGVRDLCNHLLVRW
jgi:FkbM family methyltransferase